MRNILVISLLAWSDNENPLIPCNVVPGQNSISRRLGNILPRETCSMMDEPW